MLMESIDNYVSYIRAESEYVQKCLDYPEESDKDRIVPILKWTKDKRDLIELIYSLYSTRSFNDGKVTLKAIMDCLSRVFQIKLEKYSDDFGKMSIRKDRTSFLKELMEGIELYMDKGHT